MKQISGDNIFLPKQKNRNAKHPSFLEFDFKQQCSVFSLAAT